MHIHLGALTAITVFLYVVIIGFLWRTLSAMLSDTSVGKAMAFIY